jgi:hypothetical protein
MAYERVYTVWDYYDGVRSGIANYTGHPHHYACEWDKEADDYAVTFLLTPIDEDTLALALEQWRIFRDWEMEFHRGQRSQGTHPGLPGQNSRYTELDALLKTRLAVASQRHIRKRGIFRALQEQDNLPKGVIRELEVEWTDAT